MLSFLLTRCTNCSFLEKALCSVEGSLAQYGKDGWFNITYLTGKPVPNVDIRRLIYYKEILENSKWNQGLYCPPFDIERIASRAKQIAGSITPIAKRWELPVFTTTTTTSTTTTSTSSTTSTTTSTTTSSSTSTTTSSTTTTSTTIATSTVQVTFGHGTSGFLNVTSNGNTIASLTTTGGRDIFLGNGNTIMAYMSQSVPGMITLTVTDVTTSTVLYNVTSSGIAPNTNYTFTSTGHVYSIVGTASLPTTTTTSTSTTTTTTHTTTSTTTTTTTTP